MASTVRSQTITKGKRPSIGAKGITRKAVAARLPKRRAPTHPGEMLLEEYLKPLGISQVEFAARLGVSFPRLNEIIKRHRGVTPDTALRLARVLGTTAEFWLGLQLDWDLWHAMKSADYLKIEQLRPVV
jgi:addiction module HigA family antidote